MSKMRHQISTLKNKNHSYLVYYLQNVKLQETHLKHNFGSYISILKGHLNSGTKMWRKKRKKSVVSSWSNKISKIISFSSQRAPHTKYTAYIFSPAILLISGVLSLHSLHIPLFTFRLICQNEMLRICIQIWLHKNRSGINNSLYMF